MALHVHIEKEVRASLHFWEGYGEHQGDQNSSGRSYFLLTYCMSRHESEQRLRTKGFRADSGSLRPMSPTTPPSLESIAFIANTHGLVYYVCSPKKLIVPVSSPSVLCKTH